MSDEAIHRNPFRCFQGTFLRITILFVLAILVLTYFGKLFSPGTPARLAIASVAALLTAAFVVVCVLSIRKLDELLLKVHLEAIAISFTASGALMAGWGMLEHAGAPRMEWGLWAWPLMSVLWAVAVAIRSRRYQ